MIPTLRILTLYTLLTVALCTQAASIDITASFNPSIANPENNEFTNTTPQSGFCANSPSSCIGFHGIKLPLSAYTSKPITPNSSIRDGVFFRIPSAIRRISLLNETTGEYATVFFRTNLISVRYTPNTGGTNTWGLSGKDSIGYPENTSQNGCSSSSGTGDVLSSGEKWAEFGWFIGTNSLGCYRLSGITRQHVEYSDISIGYKLQAPNPLKMSAGIYTGEYTFMVGAGQDFDFGDNFLVSDTLLTVKFKLTVTHELKLTVLPDDQNVALQPCATSSVCSEDDGKANWERWMVSRIPPALTGRSSFYLSSSGTFTVHLACEQQIGSDCALKSDRMPSQQVPVRTLLTLPSNIVDNATGSTIVKQTLQTSNDKKQTFATKSFGQNKKGSIDFMVSNKDVETMLKTRPDTYRGAVTIIFDPTID
ncbi:hypothetical protein [Citrobacter portucalensis]|uniref:hypothetical protein n=1 Tax=Citrobacter portucalensis TaxID=1639133 RepID=UPI003BF4B05D